MKKEKIFVNIACNVIITTVLLALVAVGLSGGATVVFGSANKAVYRGNTNEKCVSLMFNTYLGEDYVDGIIAELARYDAKATFFVGGIFAAKNPDTVRRIAASGNEVANHGFLHLEAKDITYKQSYDEIMMCENQFKSLGVPFAKLFAPPAGSLSDNMFRAADALGYTVIMWSKDTIDWRDKSAVTVTERATKDTKNGYLVLMHPTEHTLAALPKILSHYAAAGFRITTVTEALKPTAA